MQLRSVYPVDTATGACLVTHDYDPSEGVIDLDVDLDTLPTFGKLCLSAKAVRAMADLLGYSLSSKAAVEALRAERDSVTAELADLRARVQLVYESIMNVADRVDYEGGEVNPAVVVAELETELQAEKASKAAVKGHLTRAKNELAEVSPDADEAASERQGKK